MISIESFSDSKREGSVQDRATKLERGANEKMMLMVKWKGSSGGNQRMEKVKDGDNMDTSWREAKPEILHVSPVTKAYTVGRRYLIVLGSIPNGAGTMV